MNRKEEKLTKEFDDYHTVAKRYEVSRGGKSMTVCEMVDGSIKNSDATHGLFNNYAEMISAMDDETKIIAL